MKIKKLSINSFRCLSNFEIEFEDDCTIIVGENDCGKTSLMECLKVITQNKIIELDDFDYDAEEICLKVEIENFIFEKHYKKEGENVVELPLIAKPTREFLLNLLTKFNGDGFDLRVQEDQDELRNISKLFGLTVRSNTKIEILKERLLQVINENVENQDFQIEGAQFPTFNNIQLDGKHFENVSAFFKEVFLKEKQSSIWNEKINEDLTIEEFIKNKVGNYSQEISEKINERGIKGKIQLFLKDLTDIKIEPIYQTKDLNIDAKVKFLENGQEINLQKKGDGTKRRITMALLEFKKEQKLLSHDDSTIYLLDEPDTHLHVKAQIELLDTLKSFAEQGNQVIVTTHSPFLINAVMPNQIRLLYSAEQNKSKIRYLKKESEISDKVLRAIGIENIYLFFAKTLILVEGETEECFIPNYYTKIKNKTLSSNLIKVINTKGIENIYGFARGIRELHNPQNIHVIFDNDASPELRRLIDEIGIEEQQKYIIGTKEFEDAFSSETLQRCWAIYHENTERNCPENWTVEKIEQLRIACQGDSTLKFSKKLRQLSCGGKRMTKPIFGRVLAEYIQEHEIPEKLNELIAKI